MTNPAAGRRERRQAAIALREEHRQVAEKDMDVALDLAQSVKLPLPLNGLVDQFIKSMNRERMQSLLSCT